MGQLIQKAQEKVDYFLGEMNDRLASILMGVGVFCSAVVLHELLIVGNWLLLWWYIAGTLAFQILASGYVHRYVCHKSWECPRWLDVLFASTSGGLGVAPVIQWSAIHRQHHAHVNTENDAHGPHFSVWHNLNVSFIPPRVKYVRDLLRNKLYRAQYKYYLPLSIATALLFISVFGFPEWCFVYLTVVGHQVISVYTGHWMWMPQNHLMAAIYSPEQYHDAHHEDAQSARLGLIDIPYWLLIQWFPHNEGRRG